jgi:hypothetical protein
VRLGRASGSVRRKFASWLILGARVVSNGTYCEITPGAAAK